MVLSTPRMGLVNRKTRTPLFCLNIDRCLCKPTLLCCMCGVAVVTKMEKNEFRAMIKHFYLKKWIEAQIKAELDGVHGDSAPALKTVYFWINEFKCGRTSTENEARFGRPVEVTTPDMVEKICGMIMEDR